MLNEPPIWKSCIDDTLHQMHLLIAIGQNDLLCVKIITENCAPKTKAAVGQDVVIRQTESSHVSSCNGFVIHCKYFLVANSAY